jgi:Zn finger protein HypA/HybF involved in hydrogenase expression
MSIDDWKKQELGYIARQRYEENPYLCPQCNEPIPYEKRHNKFCNQSCAASFNNKGVVRVRTTRDANCANCGNKKEKRHNKYCDVCISQGVHIRRYDDPAQAKHDPARKRILLSKREYKCESCGLSEWIGQKIPLELDHIDGNSDNNNESNLRLICPNCHALTETYKGANAGKNSSRHKMRRKRYSEGKTY